MKNNAKIGVMGLCFSILIKCDKHKHTAKNPIGTKDVHNNLKKRDPGIHQIG